MLKRGHEETPTTACGCLKGDGGRGGEKRGGVALKGGWEGRWRGRKKKGGRRGGWGGRGGRKIPGRGGRGAHGGEGEGSGGGRVRREGKGEGGGGKPVVGGGGREKRRSMHDPAAERGSWLTCIPVADKSLFPFVVP